MLSELIPLNSRDPPLFWQSSSSLSIISSDTFLWHFSLLYILRWLASRNGLSFPEVLTHSYPIGQQLPSYHSTTLSLLNKAKFTKTTPERADRSPWPSKSQLRGTPSSVKGGVFHFQHPQIRVKTPSLMSIISWGALPCYSELDDVPRYRPEIKSPSPNPPSPFESIIPRVGLLLSWSYPSSFSPLKYPFDEEALISLQQTSWTLCPRLMGHFPQRGGLRGLRPR